MTHDFTLRLKGMTSLDDLGDKGIDALYDGGCNDGIIGSSAGITTIIFDRKSHSRKEAIDSAMADVRKAGFDPELW